MHTNTHVHASHRPHAETLILRPTIYAQIKKLPRKWRKCNLVSGYGLCGSQLGWAMNWMDRPLTSADERADERRLSGRRAVVIA